MSASEQMRAMLDQLMGTARNGKYFLNILSIFLALCWKHFMKKILSLMLRKNPLMIVPENMIKFCAFCWFLAPHSFLGLFRSFTDPSYFSVEQPKLLLPSLDAKICHVMYFSHTVLFFFFHSVPFLLIFIDFPNIL